MENQKTNATGKDWEILIATGPLDEEWLTAEIYYQGEQWGELSEFGECVTLYPRIDGMSWKLKYDDTLAILQAARAKLKGIS